MSANTSSGGPSRRKLRTCRIRPVRSAPRSQLHRRSPRQLVAPSPGPTTSPMTNRSPPRTGPSSRHTGRTTRLFRARPRPSLRWGRPHSGSATLSPLRGSSWTSPSTRPRSSDRRFGRRGQAGEARLQPEHPEREGHRDSTDAGGLHDRPHTARHRSERHCGHRHVHLRTATDARCWTTRRRPWDSSTIPNGRLHNDGGRVSARFGGNGRLFGEERGQSSF